MNTRKLPTLSIVLAAAAGLMLLAGSACGPQGGNVPTGDQQTPPPAAAPQTAEPPAQAPPPAQQMPPPAAPAKSQPAKTTHPAAPATGSTTTTTQQTPPAAPAPAGAPTPVFDMVAIPEGKNITVILDQGLSSKTGQAGQMISGTVKKDVQTRDHPMPIIPAGSVISGQIIEVQKASQMKGQAKLVVRFDTLKLTTGKTLPIVASIGAQGADTSSRTAAGIAGGAVAGAILGRIIGKDTKGTVIGAVAGGAIGTGVVMGLDNKDIDLPQGTDIMLNVDQTFDVPVPKKDA